MSELYAKKEAREAAVGKVKSIVSDMVDKDEFIDSCKMVVDRFKDIHRPEGAVKVTEHFAR